MTTIASRNNECSASEHLQRRAAVGRIVTQQQGLGDPGPHARRNIQVAASRLGFAWLRRGMKIGPRPKGPVGGIVCLRDLPPVSGIRIVANSRSGWVSKQWLGCASIRPSIHALVPSVPRLQLNSTLHTPLPLPPARRCKRRPEREKEKGNEICAMQTRKMEAQGSVADGSGSDDSRAAYLR